MAGGVQALIEHPDQRQRLRDDPGLLDSAVDEIIRWTTPVKHFMRTATEPYELRGHGFEPGDMLLLSYPSANRDEEVFDDPFRFDVGRSPNNHLAFGFGAHYCLGAKLAKMEIKALLTDLVPGSVRSSWRASLPWPTPPSSAASNTSRSATSCADLC